MIKKSLTAMLMLGSLVVNPLFASPVFSKLMPMLNQKVSILKSHAGNQIKQNDRDFSAFSGTWSGKCDNDDDDGETLVIEGDEVGLTIDGLPFTLGTLETQASANMGASLYLHSMLEWPKKSDSPLIKLTYALYSPIDNSNMVGYEEGRLSLKDNQLTLTMTSRTLSTEENETNVCTYNKQ